MPTCLLLPQCSLLLPPSVLFWVEAQPLLALFFIIALSAPLESSLPLSLSLERSLVRGHMARVQNSMKQFQRSQTKRGVDEEIIEQILMPKNNNNDLELALTSN